MFHILKEPDDLRIVCEKENLDAVVRTELKDRKLYVWLKADETRPEFICMRWNHRISEPTRIMGDKWERSYGDMEWHSLNGEIFMPWYFLANSGDETVGCGVMVQPNSFVSFQCDASGVTAWFDVRCGAMGVQLDGRELLAGVIVCEQYKGITAFTAAKEFCKVMSPNPRLPKEPVYGSNNWYYAYGESSYEDIMVDADIIAELAGKNANKPYMVVDDGWSVNHVAGPWRSNDKFGDMGKVAADIKKKNLKAGLWLRPLHDKEAEANHPEWRLKKSEPGSGSSDWVKVKDHEYLGYLDPSHPEVKSYLKANIEQIREWGFDLIKHDFSTYDMFDYFGDTLNGKIAATKGWSFYDCKKTSAEIILDFYRLLREAAGDMVIIGCNTISHLCAGLVELYRSGDDTSGREWSRTRAYGVNTLAFRLCQNDAFYKVDADCVGVMGDYIDWKLNRQWLDLLARSGSPLFVSLQPDKLTEEMKQDLTEAFRINSVQKDVAEPLDWQYNNQPQQWDISGDLVEYDFVMDSYPLLLDKKIQPY